MFVVNIRGLWILAALASLVYWCALGGPIPTAWHSNPPDDEMPYTPLWQPLITKQVFSGDDSGWVTHNPQDPEYEAERDVGGSDGIDYGN